MSLTDAKVRNAKTQKKQEKLYDGDGLYLLVTPPGKKTPEGGKCWRFKYRFNGKEQLLALGTYPEVSLVDARGKRDEARKQVAAGIDPNEVRKAQKTAKITMAANSFEVIAREWYEQNKPNSTNGKKTEAKEKEKAKKWSIGHAKTQLSRLERDILPWLGAKAIAEIEAPEVLKVLRRVESRGALETAHREKTICGQIFRYAIATGRAKRDVSADLKGALPPVAVRHHAAITDPKELAGLLRAIDGYRGGLVVKSALQIAPMFFVRPGELRHGEWSEIDFDNGLWMIPEERMKGDQPHIVPIPTQALNILKELYALTGNSRFIFPNGRSFARPMSENAVNAALRRMGYSSDEMTGHGFRAAARTILAEVHEFREDFIEHQLAHKVKDPNGRAYNRTKYLRQRREMMQIWADYLDELKNGQK